MESTVIVLRHAAAGDRAAWGAADRWRPLDVVGLGQSLELAGAFDGLAISRIMTSPYARCQQTVAALAALRRLPVLDRSWLAEGVDPRRVEQGLATVGPDTLLCTHGETARLLRRLMAPGHELDDLDKGAAWVLRFTDDVLTAADHVAAPSGAAVVPELAAVRR